MNFMNSPFDVPEKQRLHKNRSFLGHVRSSAEFFDGTRRGDVELELRSFHELEVVSPLVYSESRHTILVLRSANTPLDIQGFQSTHRRTRTLQTVFTLRTELIICIVDFVWW